MTLHSTSKLAASTVGAVCISFSFASPSFSQAPSPISNEQLPLFIPIRAGVDESQLAVLPKDKDAFQFDLKVVRNKGVSLVEFVLASCPACNPTSSMLIDLLSRCSSKVSYLRLDLNKNLRLSFHYDVPEVPAILVFRNGKLSGKFVSFKNSDKSALARLIAREIWFADLEQSKRSQLAQSKPVSVADGAGASPKVPENADNSTSASPASVELAPITSIPH